MTIGIYCLKFLNTNKFYIGQSINIENRYKAHIASFKNSTCNIKMLEAYKQYGEPILEILCECSIEELQDNENKYLKEYNAVIEGLNIYKYANEAPCNYGEASGHSKYTNNSIEKVFKYLIDISSNISFKEIEQKTNVSIDTIRKISSLTQHTWLKNLYPEEYKILENLKSKRGNTLKSAKDRGIVYPPIKSPKGIIYNNIEHLTNFAKEHSLQASNLCLLLKGKQKQHKGWTLA